MSGLGSHPRLDELAEVLELRVSMTDQTEDSGSSPFLSIINFFSFFLLDLGIDVFTFEVDERLDFALLWVLICGFVMGGLSLDKSCIQYISVPQVTCLLACSDSK